jgi:hypothetical protein
MNTDKFASNAIVTDPASVGFSVQEMSDLLFKKYSWRATTSAQIPYWKEQINRPLVHADQIFGEDIPQTPPVDFVVLTNSQIAALFAININELAVFSTTINGNPTFQIEQSVSYPYILRITQLKLQPMMGNPDFAFNAVTPVTNVNLLAHPIHFSLYNNAYRGTIYRTTGSGEIGFNGYDEIKETQFSYVFDTDNGIFTSYEVDNPQFYPNSVNKLRPPAVSCYVYRGSFGFDALVNSGVLSIQINNETPAAGPITFTSGKNISLSTINSNNFLITGAGASNTWNDVGSNDAIYYNAGPVIVGVSNVVDPAYALSVVGTTYTTTLLTENVYTTSDKHLKDNIQSFIPNQNILNISTVSYNYISKPNVPEIGLIAQDVEQYFPQLVKEFNGFKSVQYDRIGVLLLPIVREQNKKIKELEESLNELKCITYSLLRSGAGATAPAAPKL